MNDRKRNTTALVLNTAVIAFELYALSYTFFFASGSFDISAFQFYTNDSNIVALFASVFYVVSSLSGKGRENASRIRFIAQAGLTLTFLVVLCILIPLEPESAEHLLLERAFFFEHLACPVISFVSFVFFEESSLSRRDVILALLPTALYGIVIVVLNLLGTVDGPYPFLRIREQSPLMSAFWFLLILCSDCLVAGVLLFLSKKRQR